MGKKNIKETLADETNILVNTIIEQGVNAVIGGFPCQDASVANTTGKGVDGRRTGLIWKMVQTIRLVRPDLVLLENVPALFSRGVQRIFWRLASLGYDIEWDCISAGAAGAPHHRARAYILAYPRGDGGLRFFKKPLQRQPDFSWCENIRSLEDLRNRPNLFASTLCGSYPGLAKRLHGIGNGNPPCIIREIMKNINHENTTKG